MFDDGNDNDCSSRFILKFNFQPATTQFYYKGYKIHLSPLNYFILIYEFIICTSQRHFQIHFYPQIESFQNLNIFNFRVYWQKITVIPQVF